MIKQKCDFRAGGAPCVTAGSGFTAALPPIPIREAISEDCPTTSLRGTDASTACDRQYDAGTDFYCSYVSLCSVSDFHLPSLPNVVVEDSQIQGENQRALG